MRSFSITLVVLVLVAMVAAQSVITNFDEYQRKKAEYDRQKAKYDEFQSLSRVPVLAGYDLIPKGRDADQAPGRAEQLPPEYTGMPIVFQNNTIVGGVQPGNTAQNYFHTGPIPAKKSSSPSPGPIAIPVAPGQDFVIPEQNDEPAPLPEVPEVAAPAPPAPAEVPAVPLGPESSSSGQALFFGRGALPALAAQAEAPVQTAAEFSAPAAAPPAEYSAPASSAPAEAPPAEYSAPAAGPTRVSFEGSSSGFNFALREESQRAAAAAAAAAAAPAPLPLSQLAPAPIPFFQLAPAPAPAPAPAQAQFITFSPAQTYGPPGFRR